MELDKKIKVKKIFDCFSDFEEVKKYFNKAVYCADFIKNILIKRYIVQTLLKIFQIWNAIQIHLFLKNFICKSVNRLCAVVSGTDLYCQLNLWNRKSNIEHIPYLNFT